MSPPVFVSTGAFDAPNLGAALDLAAEWGSRFVELSSGVPWAAGNVDLARQRAGAFTFLVHNYFPGAAEPFVLNLASADDDTRNRSLAHCRAAIELSAELGAPFFAAHAGYALDPDAKRLGQAIDSSRRVPLETAHRHMLESVRALCAHAHRHGIAFYVENNVVAPFNAPGGRNDWLLLAEPAEMETFAAEVGDPAFRYLLDAAHLSVTARTLGFDRTQALRRLSPLVGGWHLSDNDQLSDSNQPFGRDAWFLAEVAATPAKAVVIEAYRLKRAELDRCLDAVDWALRGEGQR
ncbi:MAG: sugar phosphate isomerase/epimerase [Alphaproteobacteria bacterium]|nr:sugar phosphate isomerase/epimerase [Alphaproteobacteria bacterium]